jgi:hypothetical protein
MSTVFTLEAVFAKKGDALILHYGPWDRPNWILIDGGPRGVYKKFLHPRLNQLREEFEMEPDDPIPFKMVMVSHIDDDHIAGVIDLFEDIEEAKAGNQPPPYEVDTLWHNSFDDILDNDDEEILSRMAATAASSGAANVLALPRMTRESRAVVASTRQGRNLRNLAKTVGASLNKPFEGLIMAPAPEDVPFNHDLSLTVVGPSKTRVEEYQEQWDKDLKKILEKEENSAEAAAFEDKSPFNLASICVLAKMQGKSMLLTGDARGDFVIEGLEEAELLNESRPLRLDLLKVPHHGSDRNVELEFFQRIVADHYVISGDGEHGNPEVETLEMIRDARDDDEYTIHFTFTENAHLTATNEKRKAALKKVADWVAQKPDNCTVVFQDDDEEIYSVYVDLLDPLYEE